MATIVGLIFGHYAIDSIRSDPHTTIDNYG
jgi:hypothetical protein